MNLMKDELLSQLNTSETRNSRMMDYIVRRNWPAAVPVLWGVREDGLPPGAKKRGFSDTALKMIQMLTAMTVMADDFAKSRKAVGIPHKPGLSRKDAAAFFGNGKKLLRAVKTAAEPDKNLNGVFLVLAAARALEWLKTLEGFSPDVWQELLDTLAQVAADARVISLEDTPVQYLLMAGELPLTLAAYFPEMPQHNTWVKQAVAVMEETLDVLLDGAGMVQAKNLGVSRVLLASWTRMKWLDWELSSLGENNALPREESTIFSQAVNHQYEWVSRCAIHLTRPDGTLMFSPEGAKTGAWEPGLFTAVRVMDADADNQFVLAPLALPGYPKYAVEAAEKEPVPESVNISEWSAVAVMRGAWDREESVSALTWEKPVPRVELGNLGTTLISGDWDYEIKWNGKPLVAADTWDMVCHEDSDDVGYVELEMLLTDGFRFQRSVALAKREGFVLLADAVLPPEEFMEASEAFMEPWLPAASTPPEPKKLRKNQGLEYTARLPIFPGVKAGENADSFEMSLYTPREIKALVLPLALPEWRHQVGKTEGLMCKNGMLEYRCHSPREAIFAPLFFDLYDERLHSSLTWRRLTVAQKLQKVPAYIASGTRVMVADSQWLIYRSLAPAANRSLLGHNLTSENFIGTFDEEGNVDAILEIR